MFGDYTQLSTMIEDPYGWHRAQVSACLKEIEYLQGKVKPAATGAPGGFFQKVKESFNKGWEKQLQKTQQKYDQFAAPFYPRNKAWEFEEADAAITNLLRQLITNLKRLHTQFPYEPGGAPPQEGGQEQGAFSTFNLMDTVVSDYKNGIITLCRLYDELQHLQGKREELLSSFVERHLDDWHEAKLHVEMQKRRRDLTEMSQPIIPATSNLNRIPFDGVLSVERRFLQTFIDELQVRLGSSFSTSPDGVQMNAARRRKRNAQGDVEMGAGGKLEKLAALQQWKKEKRREIVSNRSLSVDEQEEQLDMLEVSYNQAKKKIETESDIFENS